MLCFGGEIHSDIHRQSISNVQNIFLAVLGGKAYSGLCYNVSKKPRGTKGDSTPLSTEIIA